MCDDKDSSDKLSKKEKRWENKKKKVKAFLEVAKLNDKDKEKASEAIENIKDSIRPCDEENGEGATEKKKNKPLDMDDLRVLRQQLHARQKLAMQKSKVFGILDHIHIRCAVCPGDEPRKSSCEESKSLQGTSTGMEQPLFAVDLQHLILYGLQGHIAACRPRWCKLLRPEKLSQIVVLEMANITKKMFLEQQDSLGELKELGFSMCVEVIGPAQYNSNFLKDIAKVPISNSSLMKQGKIESSKKTSAGSLSRQVVLLRTDSRDWACAPTDLMMSSRQMIRDGYPMPVDLDRCSDFLFTADEYKNVTETSPLFAVDCEMCQTEKGEIELTYIAVVNEKLETIYLSLVKPRNRVINYLTKYSGVTKALLKTVTTRLEDVQAKLREILPPDAILCGQSFGNDLKALKMFHPYVIDTSVIFNLSGSSHLKSSLKKLTQFFLNKTIQDDPLGHSPEQDAVATMELVLLKLKNGLSFGDVTYGLVALDSSSNVDDVKEEEGKKSTSEADIYQKIIASEVEKRKLESLKVEDEPRKKKQKTEADNASSSSSSSSEQDNDDQNVIISKKKKVPTATLR